MFYFMYEKIKYHLHPKPSSTQGNTCILNEDFLDSLASLLVEIGFGTYLWSCL